MINPINRNVIDHDTVLRALHARMQRALKYKLAIFHLCEAHSIHGNNVTAALWDSGTVMVLYRIGVRLYRRSPLPTVYVHLSDDSAKISVACSTYSKLMTLRVFTVADEDFFEETIKIAKNWFEAK